MEYTIGIDLGGTSIKYALVDKAGQPFFEGRLPALASVSASAVIGQLVKAVVTLSEEATRQHWTVKGIGLGTPGIVDETNRIVLGGAENITGWENIDVASLLEEQTNLPVVVGNDANLMGLGETKYGAGRGCTHVVFLTVGTGIGGAVIIDGKLFNGFANRGTELGHVPLVATGERCACGAVGCLEHYASTAALVRRFTTRVGGHGTQTGQQRTEADEPGMQTNDRRMTFDTEINGELIVRLYHEGFQPAIDSMNEHFYYLGRGIAGFINVFSPQRLVIGGGVSEAGSFYLEKIKEVVRRNTIADCALNTEIVAAELGNRAGVIGAASLWLNSSY